MEHVIVKQGSTPGPCFTTYWARCSCGKRITNRVLGALIRRCEAHAPRTTEPEGTES